MGSPLSCLTRPRTLRGASARQPGEPALWDDGTASFDFLVTTMTGHLAWCSTACDVEPRSRPAKPPRPREPTTTRSAAVENSVSSSAPVPSRTIRRTFCPGKSCRTRSTNDVEALGDVREDGLVVDSGREPGEHARSRTHGDTGDGDELAVPDLLLAQGCTDGALGGR